MKKLANFLKCLLIMSNLFLSVILSAVGMVMTEGRELVYPRIGWALIILCVLSIITNFALIVEYLKGTRDE